MKNIVQLFREAWKAKYQDLGFYRHNNRYFRIVNGIVQSFELERICSGREVRLSFSIYPLYSGISPYWQRYDLKNFVLPHDSLMFCYDLHDELSIKNCANMLLEKMDEIVIPAFKRAVNDEVAFMENHSLIKTDWLNRRQVQKESGYKDFFLDRKDVWIIEELRSVEQRALALKLQRFDFAIASFQEEIKFERQMIADQQEVMRDYPLEYVIEAAKERITAAQKLILVYEDWIAHIRANNFEWISERLRENEKRTIERLELMAPLSKFGLVRKSISG